MARRGARMMGALGDTHDNAVAESTNGLHHAKAIHQRGPWRSRAAVQFATLEWVDGFSHRRLLAPICKTPPAEAEARCRAAEDNLLLAA